MKELPGHAFSSIGIKEKGEPPTYWCKQGLGARHWDLVIQCDWDSKVTTIDKRFRDDRLGITSTSVKLVHAAKNIETEQDVSLNDR